MSDCILKRARCLEMKGTLSAGRPHRPPWSPQSCWLRLAFSLKAAPINCEGDPYEESYISPSQMWPHSVTSLKTRSVLGIFWLSHTLWHVISLKNRTHKTRPRDKSAQNSFSERKTILTRGGISSLHAQVQSCKHGAVTSSSATFRTPAQQLNAR